MSGPDTGPPAVRDFGDSEPPRVEVFWQPGCPYCRALRSVLLDHAVDATWRNIWADEEARALVREVNHGNETVPTVRVGMTTLTNPSWRQLAPVLERTTGRELGEPPAAVPGRPLAVAALRWALIVLVVLAGDSRPALVWLALALWRPTTTWRLAPVLTAGMLPLFVIRSWRRYAAKPGQCCSRLRAAAWCPR
jgi:glutaredoxin